ncbi:unnamed protein product [Soboliphyme baturini]|uniref:Large ribosomal subunit protein mL64 n=1 Tax=Soboliphyme baturini TaxID=241478 RepID=A0A3P8B444_9BILA|nr:unnamed protein product [Soboliphyme baturini]
MYDLFLEIFPDLFFIAAVSDDCCPAVSFALLTVKHLFSRYRWQKERWALKERYAMYGRSSGVVPGVMWPTRSELEEIIAEEKEWSPQFQDTVDAVKAEAKELELKQQARIKQVESNVKNYAKELEKYREKLRKKEEEIEKAKAMKMAKVREIQVITILSFLHTDV